MSIGFAYVWFYKGISWRPRDVVVTQMLMVDMQNKRQESKEKKENQE